MSKELEARLDAIESRFAIDALIANDAEAFDTMNIELPATLRQPESRLHFIMGTERFGHPA